MPIDIRIHYQGKMAKYTCNPALSHDIPCLCCFPLTKPMSLSQKCRAYPSITATLYNRKMMIN